ncbi:MAG: translocation/assembly module TamB domain-containing protein [Bacteroidales bacterium]
MVLTVLFLFRLPLVQTVAARLATPYISGFLHTGVDLGTLEIRSFKTIRLSRVLVLDHHQDTLVYIGEASVTSYHWPSIIRKPRIESVSFDSLSFMMKTYKGEQVSSLTHLLQKFPKGNTDTTLTVPEIKVANIKLNGGRFRFDNNNREPVKGQVDYRHPDITGINLNATGFRLYHDTLRLEVGQLSFAEKSGFELDSLQGKLSMGPGFIEGALLKIRTPESSLNLDLRFGYDSFRDFNDFVNKIRIETSIRPSILNLAGIGYFAPELFGMRSPIKVMGDISGTVSNFRAKGFRFALGDETRFKGDIRMNGLPDITETFIHLNVASLHTVIPDVREFRLPGGESIRLPGFLDRFGKVNVTGKFTGFYNDFVSYARFNTDLGKLRTDLLLRVDKQNRIAYSGELVATDFHAGKLASIPADLQKLDLNVHVEGFGLDPDEMNLTASGVVDSLEFRGNLYNEIALNGIFDKKIFEGYIAISDELGNVDFSGTLDFRSAIPHYQFTARIEDAYLSRIHLINRGPEARLSTVMNINLFGNGPDNMQGIVMLDSTYYREKSGRIGMDSFTLSITRDADDYAFVSLYSDIADATVEGYFQVNALPGYIQSLLSGYSGNLAAHIAEPEQPLPEMDFTFNAKIKESRQVTGLFLPDWEIEPGTSITGSLNTSVNNLFVSATSGGIDYRGVAMKDVRSELYVADEYLFLGALAREMKLSDTLGADSLDLALKLFNDTLQWDMKWGNLPDFQFSQGNIEGDLVFATPDSLIFDTYSGKFTWGTQLWNVSAGKVVTLDTSGITVHQLNLESQQQAVSIRGGLVKHRADTLNISFRNFDLSAIDLLTENSGVSLNGVVEGSFAVIDYYNNPNVLSDLTINNLEFNGESLGDATLKSAWTPESKAFDIRGDFIYTGNIGQRKILGIEGKYFPGNRENNFDFDVSFDNFRLQTLDPVFSSFARDVKGYATGSVKVTGKKESPMFNGSVEVMHGSMLIDFNRVKYSFADRLDFDGDRLLFDKIVVYDSLGNQAQVSGMVRHRGNAKFDIELNVTTDGILGLNTTRTPESLYYGVAFASGTMRIAGPTDDLDINIRVKSEKGTSVKLPVSYGAEVINNDYIVFVNPDNPDADTVDSLMQNRYTAKVEGINLDMETRITNDAEIQIFMPYRMGNLRARGAGNLIFKMNPQGELTIDGQYVIDRGSFFLTLQNIINRDFTIRRGSKVSWTGDPYNAKIDLTAVYKVKTKLGDYGPPADSATRVPVDCVISLKKSLLDPEIRFTIEFPDLKDDTRQYIYSRLDTADQALMSQQMISLLVLNSFYQGTGYTGSVGFNTYSLLTNQINNWLSGLSNDFDIGVNYRPGDNLSAREVELALSTHLFDDRVTINGNVGVRETSNTENTNNIVGEVTVEVKITPDGKLRGKFFNRSNNELIYYKNAPYTQGVGLYYEFNKLSLRNLFGKKEEKK